MAKKKKTSTKAPKTDSEAFSTESIPEDQDGRKEPVSCEPAPSSDPRKATAGSRWKDDVGRTYTATKGGLLRRDRDGMVMGESYFDLWEFTPYE